jgi:hypothetical protein
MNHDERSRDAYGITAVAFVVAFVDWLARRRDRQKREGRT